MVTFATIFNQESNIKKYTRADVNKKLNPIYSIGTCKPYKGNQKFEIKENLETVIFKPER